MLPLSAGTSPLGLLRRLRGEGREGLALLESADLLGDRGTPRQSILVIRALVRLGVDARGQASVAPLCDGIEPLVDELRARVESAASATAGALESAAALREPEPTLDAVRAAAGLIADHTEVPFPPGVVGAFGYEIVDRFEPLPPRKPDPADERDASFVVVGDVVVFDHRAGQVHVITRGMPWEAAAVARARHSAAVELAKSAAEDQQYPADVAPVDATPDVEDAEFLNAVRTLREHIGAGDIFQAVVSRGLQIDSGADTLDVYGALRQRNPSPYMFHLDLGDGVLFGASPETFLRVEDRVVEIRPIAGTVPRGFAADGGIDPDTDARLALSLLLDDKEQAEHAMLLDLARNDIARVSQPGTTRVTQQFVVEKYSHVQHLVSRVQGDLRDDLDALHAYRAAANMGTLTGAPKPKAMELVRGLEPHARGYYGGAAGYLLQDGRFDSCIVIRSLRYRNGSYVTRAGAGVVWDSIPERELAETEHKSVACRQAIAMAEAAS